MHTLNTQTAVRQITVQRSTPFWFWPAQWFTLGLLAREWTGHALTFM